MKILGHKCLLCGLLLKVLYHHHLTFLLDKKDIITFFYIYFIYFQKGGVEALKGVSNLVQPNMINIPSYARWYIRLAGLSGATAVALGAYGAHGN